MHSPSATRRGAGWAWLCASATLCICLGQGFESGGLGRLSNGTHFQLGEICVASADLLEGALADMLAMLGKLLFVHLYWCAMHVAGAMICCFRGMLTMAWVFYKD